MQFSVRPLVICAAVAATQIGSAVCFLPPPAKFPGVVSSRISDTSLCTKRGAQLQVVMQARDKTGKASRATLAATAFNRHAGRRAQLSTQVAVADLTEKKNQMSFKSLRPISSPFHVEDDEHKQIDRVKELSSLLSQYHRILTKMGKKMVDPSKRAALLPKFEQLLRLREEGLQVLSVLKSDYARRSMSSFYSRWNEQGRREAAEALDAAQQQRRGHESVADKLFHECVHILEVDETV